MLIEGRTSWTLQALLARHGQAEVWQALNESGPVIVKRLVDGNPGAASLLKEEADLLAELEGGSYPVLLDSRFAAAESFLVMTQLRGVPLTELLGEGALTRERAIELTCAILQALDGLHGQGVIHCDLKPEHVLVDEESVALCDFGYARRLRLAARPEGGGATPAYAAPEQLGLVRAEVGAPADLYAVGLILAEMLLGRRLYQEEWQEKLQPLDRRQTETLDPATIRLLERCLKPDPEQRYQTCQGLLHDLKRLGDTGTPFALGTRDPRRTPRPPSMVGREDEVRELARLVSSKGAEVVWLSGISGRGKSRVMRALETRLIRQGLPCLWARIQPTTSGVGRRVWDAVVDQVVEHAENTAVMWREVRERLGARAGLLARAFPQLDMLGPADANIQPRMAGLANALSDLLSLCANGGLILLFDDVQWADALTAHWLTQRLPDGVRAVAAFREEEVDESHPLWQASRKAAQLTTLSDDQARDLVLSMTGPLPQSALEAILHRGAGEPFLLEAVTHGAFETGALKPDSEGWAWNEAEALRAGDRAGAVLATRLQLLSDPCRQMLQAGALVGRSFSLSQALSIAQVPDDRRGEIAQEAAAHHLVWRVGDSLEMTHDKIREELLASVPDVDKPSAHRRAAQWCAENREADFASMAYHWSRAGEWAEARYNAVKGAHGAVALLDFPTATALWNLAYQNLQPNDPPRMRGELAWELGRTLSLQSHFAKAVDKLEEAVELLDEREAKLRATGELCYALSRAVRLERSKPLIISGLAALGVKIPANPVWQLGEAAYCWLLIHGSLRGYRPLPQRAEPLDDTKLRLLRTATEAWSIEGNLPMTLWAVANGCLAALENRKEGEGAICLAHGGIFSVMLGWVRLGEQLFLKAQEAAADHPRFLGEVLEQSAFVAIADGDLSGAVNLFKKGLDICHSQGDVWSEDTGWCILAQVQLFQGDYKSAWEAAMSAKRHPDIEDTVRVSADRAQCLMGDESLQDDLLAQRQERKGVLRLESLGEQALGLIWLHRDQPEKAIPHFEQASTIFTPEIFFFGAAASAWLATAWRRLAEKLPPEGTAVRRRCLRQAAKASDKARKDAKAWLVNQPHALRESALSAAHAGRFFSARSLFEKSFAISEKVGMAFESAWTLYERGRFARVARWSDWEKDEAQGLVRVRRLGGWIPGVALSTPEPEKHLAKLDRFDRVLEAGHRLVSLDASSPTLCLLEEEAQTLLRCDRVVIVSDRDARPEGWSHTLYERCLTEGRAVVESEVEEPSRSLLLQDARSTLMAPLKTEGHEKTVLVAWQKTIGGFFGEEETRLADYLCTLAGAGLENAQVLAQRDQAFHGMRSSEERFRGFFTHAGVGTALLDDAGTVTQENIYLNELLGQSLLGKTLWQLSHASDRQAFKDGFNALLEETDTRYDQEARLHRAGGEVAWVQLCLVTLPVRQNGESRFLLTVADTTHRRITEMMTFLENERRGLAAEVHDELGQNMAALHLKLSALEATHPQLRSARELACQLVEDTSELISSLRHPLAEGMDLMTALKDLVVRFSIESELDMQVRWPEQPLRISEPEAMVLYRVLQEGLANIRKHAKAALVELSFQLSGQSQRICLQDDGRGFETAAWIGRKNVSKHFGLLSMRDRLEMVGGTLEISSGPEQGTRLEIRLASAKS